MGCPRETEKNLSTNMFICFSSEYHRARTSALFDVVAGKMHTNGFFTTEKIKNRPHHLNVDTNRVNNTNQEKRKKRAFHWANTFSCFTLFVSEMAGGYGLPRKLPLIAASLLRINREYNYNIE